MGTLPMMRRRMDTMGVGGLGRSERDAVNFREAASGVSADDLAELGVRLPKVPGGDPFASRIQMPGQNVDMADMKFRAMKALHDAQSAPDAALSGKTVDYGGGSSRTYADTVGQAEQGVRDVELAQAAKDEVLRKRQMSYNKLANDQVGTMDPDNKFIMGLTGAAYASQAKSGATPQTHLPEARRPMTASEHLMDHPSYAQFGTPGSGIDQNSMKMKPIAMSGLGASRRSY